MTVNIFKLIEREQQRQENEICLIASENYTSKNVMKAMGSILTNKYAEGYPNHRYYGGCRYIDEIENEAIFQARQLFGCQYANVQPHSGSQANQAVYLAICKPGDKILGMSLDAGGHLTHGSKVSASGKIYNSISYGLNKNELINFNEIKEKLKENPRILIAGASAYSRKINFAKFRQLVDEHNLKLKTQLAIYLADSNDNITDDEFSELLSTTYEAKKCYFMVDMAHIAGLVAAGLHESPLPYADVVTSTTHKTLRGPRGGIILSNNEALGKKIDKAVFPGIQGGPLEHIIAAKAICFQEALKPEFKEYQQKILANMKAMEVIFKQNNIKMVSDGTDNHLILLELKDLNKSGKQLEDELSSIGIVVNKNAVKDDPRPKSETSGIRIGAACITTRGANMLESGVIASIICDVIKDGPNSEHKKYVKSFCEGHPIYENN